MDIRIERIFEAPVTRVWHVWTDPEEVVRWWGPKDWSAPSVTIDFREGGTYLYCMRGTMGPGVPIRDNWSGGVFKEIIPMEKIVATDYFTDEKGNKITPEEAGMPGEWPEEDMVVTVTFEDLGEKTKVTILHEGHPAEIANMANVGWNESLDKLAAIL